MTLILHFNTKIKISMWIDCLVQKSVSIYRAIIIELYLNSWQLSPFRKYNVKVKKTKTSNERSMVERGDLNQSFNLLNIQY